VRVRVVRVRHMRMRMALRQVPVRMAVLAHADNPVTVASRAKPSIRRLSFSLQYTREDRP